MQMVRKRALDTKVKQLCCHCESGEKMTTILKKKVEDQPICATFLEWWKITISKEEVWSFCLQKGD
jgi:hypothetical protein